jgi:acetyl esterase/lipase
LAGPYAFDPTTWPSTRDVFVGTTNPDQARPVAFVHGGAPPALLMHGLDDDVVRLWNMQTLTAALRQAGTEVQALELDGIGHLGIVTAIAAPLRWRAPVLEQMVDFINRHSR